MSPLFVGKARERFGDLPFVSYRALDVESDPATQGFSSDRFDLVIASNVLHATRDLRSTLRHVRSLVAPGGMIVLVEGTRHTHWVDLIFGMLGGWWRFADHDLRPACPLLPAATWQRVLADSGFSETTALIPADDSGLFEQAVLLARASDAVTAIPAIPTASARHWIVFSDSEGIGGELAARLEQRGDTCTHVPIPHDGQPPSRDALAPLASLRPYGCVHLWSLDAPDGGELTVDALEATNTLNGASVLHLAQALIAAELAQPPRLWLVTRGAVAAGDGALPGVAQSPLLGLGQVLSAEHPEFHCTHVDLDHAASRSDNVDRLAGEILSDAVRSTSHFAAASGSRRTWHGSPAGEMCRRRRTCGPRRSVVSDCRRPGRARTRSRPAPGRSRGQTSRSRQPGGVAARGSRAADAVEQLERRGATVRLIAADISQPADVEELVRRGGSGRSGARGSGPCRRRLRRPAADRSRLAVVPTGVGREGQRRVEPAPGESRAAVGFLRAVRIGHHPDLLCRVSATTSRRTASSTRWPRIAARLGLAGREYRVGAVGRRGDGRGRGQRARGPVGQRRTDADRPPTGARRVRSLLGRGAAERGGGRRRGDGDGLASLRRAPPGSRALDLACQRRATLPTRRSAGRRSARTCASLARQLRALPAPDRRARLVAHISAEITNVLALPSGASGRSRPGLVPHGHGLTDVHGAAQSAAAGSRVSVAADADVQVPDGPRARRPPRRTVGRGDEQAVATPVAAGAAIVPPVAAAAEPIAIVGMGCRFPGGADIAGRVLGAAARRRRRDPRGARRPLGRRRLLRSRTRHAREDATPLAAASSDQSTRSIPRSSASRRAKRRAWIRSSGCCSRSRWEALEHAGHARRRAWPARQTGVFVGHQHSTTTRSAAASRATRPDRRLRTAPATR